MGKKKYRENILHSLWSGKRTRVCMLILCDIICAGGIFWLAMWGYRLLGASTHYDLERYWKFLPFLLIFLVCNAITRSYHGSLFYPGICLNKIEEIRRITFAVFITYLLLFAWLMFSRQGPQYSRIGLLIGMVLTIPVLPVARFFVRWLMKRLKFGLIDVIIAGAGHTGEIISAEFEKSCYYGFRVVGYIDDDPKKQGQVIAGNQVLGPLSAAKRIARRQHVEYIICCLPLQLINRTFREYSKIFRHIMIIPDNRVFPISWLYPASIGLYSGFEIRNQLLLKMPRLTKNLLEAVFALTTIICLLPLFLMLALLVKLSGPGPIFYTAKRLGLNGKTIKVLKFRTMYADADQRLEKLLAEDPELEREWEEKFKLAKDPRITKIGRFLRKTSLDELPQFWNVLTGEMAVIGPRPIVKGEVRYYGENYELLARVKPGITGLWQVSGHSETDYDDRIMLDMYYIMNWSIWMDYYIFFKTVFIVLSGRGAC